MSLLRQRDARVESYLMDPITRLFFEPGLQDWQLPRPVDRFPCISIWEKFKREGGGGGLGG